MPFLKKLFGGSGAAPSAPAAEAVRHEGYEIFVEPLTESGGHRVAARIEKEVDGTRKSHRMIRADVCQNLDEARDLALMKAKQMIKEQRDGLFG